MGCLLSFLKINEQDNLECKPICKPRRGCNFIIYNDPYYVRQESCEDFSNHKDDTVLMYHNSRFGCD